MPAYDLLELFAFVLPARTAAPTARGLHLALSLEPPEGGLESQAASLPGIAERLLRRLARGRETPLNRQAAGLAARMGQAGWSWAPLVCAALGKPAAKPSADAFRVWKRLPEWEDSAPLAPPGSQPVSEAEARARLARMLGPYAEHRPGQADYAAATTAAFAPRTRRGDPHLVLAEAGTGTGKTLGYIAPASLWAERNQGAVWISTYTRHLQRQIEAELTRLFPDASERRRRVVIRKGRENYLCLLNLDEAIFGGTASPIPLGLICRWALVTEDGDLQGGDLPGWFAELFGGSVLPNLADRRGECIHGGCSHYRRCFVEHTIRRARRAELVVANHALVMAQAAWGGLDDAYVPVRYVFDEGHHLFDAADGAFSAALSGLECAELRRWLLGPEGGRSRGRGLRRRVEDLVTGHPALEARLEAILLAARALPGIGWALRLEEDTPELGGIEPGRPNPAEAFLGLLRREVLARTPGAALGQESMEAEIFPASPDTVEAASRFERALGRIAEPLRALADGFAARLDAQAEELDDSARAHIEGACRSIERRALNRLTAWREMLGRLTEPAPEPGTRPQHLLFARIERRPAGDRDVALLRHWLDPTIPFAITLAQPAHGLLVTSATLRDWEAGDPEAVWEAAEARVGASHLASPAIRVAVASPFDYGAQTRVFVVTDVAQELGQLAAAYRALFLAAGGGALGLFTAIRRLKAVHEKIAPSLEEAGIPLYAQHVDPMNNTTLVDIFRTEEHACLLGTDAMRDGV
ncbi:MAG: ATP-dependent DNA helicase, partial [Acetobacteraceae bacterium]|nr:ATP-dependent DNA helicase [Acetobacteraceae bacterium]